MKLKTFVIIIMSLLFVSQASAGILYFTDGLGTTQGGEFTAHVLKGEVGPLYDIGDTFSTFCIERDESVTLSYLSHLYYGTTNTEAIRGGTNTNSGDPLSSESAYIYTQWWSGAIAHTAANADMVQYALWYLEDESGGDWYSKAGVAALVTEAQNSDLAKAGGIGGVRVMNLYEYDLSTGKIGDYAQDMLVMTPIPATILIGLLGLGVGGWRLRKTM